jgi:hypothetical protein
MGEVLKHEGSLIFSYLPMKVKSALLFSGNEEKRKKQANCCFQPTKGGW